MPGSGYFVEKLRTTRATMLGRSFLKKNDPRPVVALIKKTLKIYPCLPGGYGTSIGSALEGKGTLARTPDHKLDWAFLRPEEPAKFIEGSGKVMNTVPPNDFSYDRRQAVRAGRRVSAAGSGADSAAQGRLIRKHRSCVLV